MNAMELRHWPRAMARLTVLQTLEVPVGWIARFKLALPLTSCLAT